MAHILYFEAIKQLRESLTVSSGYLRKQLKYYHMVLNLLLLYVP